MEATVRVLYVDDEPDLLEIGRLFLERAGDFAVTTVGSAAAGLALLEEGEFDAVVSDYQMPGMDGIEFLKAVRNGHGETPFILFTGRGREEVVIEAINNGVDFYIQKGGEPEAQYVQLSHQVRCAVERRRTRKTLRESELRFRSLIQNSSDIIRIIDRDGRIAWESESARRILGYPDGYALGRSPFDFMHPDDCDETRRALADVYAGTNPGLPTGFRLRRADGEYIHVESVGTNLIGVRGVDGIVMTTRPVEERHRAEEALQESQRRLQRAEEIAGVGHWELHLATGTVRASAGARALYGSEGETWPLERVRQVALPECRPLLEEALRDLVEGRRAYDVEYRIRRRGDGREIDLASRAEYDPERGVVFGVLHDITASKRAEAELVARNRELVASYEEIAAVEEELRSTIEELTRHERDARESGERLALILERGEIGTWDWSVDTEEVTYSEPWQGVLGLSAGEGALAVSTWEELVHPDDLPRVRQAFRDHLDGRTPIYEVEYRLRGRYGTWIWILARGKVIERDEEGRARSVAGTHLDITAKKEAEELRTRLGRVLEASMNEIYIFDPETLRFLEVNRGARENLGYSMEELRTMTPFDLKPGISRESFEALIAPLRDGDLEKQVFSTAHRRKDGSRYPVEVHIQLMRHEMAAPVFFAVVLDITERLQAEEALLRANRVLNLLSGITRHDIDNQLTVLRGYLSILNARQSDPALGSYLERSVDAAERIASMIRFTGTCEEIGLHAPVWQDLHAIVETAAGDVALGAVRLLNELPAGLEVYADTLIVRVFANLIDNVVRHGCGATVVRLRVMERDRDWTILCEDDGAGVPPGEKERIFERGYGDNTGLGLFLVREILEITGIAIHESGEPGEGARFEIAVPGRAIRQVKSAGRAGQS